MFFKNTEMKVPELRPAQNSRLSESKTTKKACLEEMNERDGSECRKRKEKRGGEE
jgi:hypothetical protein